VLRRLKANPETASIPVIVLTISRSDENITECQKLGANAYVVKPVSFQNLSEVTPQLNLSWLLMHNPLRAAA
jgi:two-component system response regulator